MAYRTLFLPVILMIAGIPALAGPASGTPFSFSLQIEHQMLRALVISAAFTEPGGQLTLSDQGDACRWVILSDPQFRTENGLLRLELKVHMTGGQMMGDKCLFPVQWEGFLVVHEKPRLHQDGWRLSFDPVDSELLNSKGQTALVMDRLWRIFEDPVLSQLKRITINLFPPVRDIRPVLLSMVSDFDAQLAESILAALHPSTVSVTPEALRIEIVSDVDVPAGEPEPAPEPLSPQELADFIGIWETWDAFLVQALLSLAGKPLSPEERDILFTVLMDTRYRFIAELSSEGHHKDFVRRQFVDAWEAISPILKNHLARSGSDNIMGYLAFFTASDALAALDRIGPAFEVEISQDGLVRLARMLSENKDLVLQYSPGVNPGLRELLGLGPPLESAPAPEPAEPEESQDAPKLLNLNRLEIGRLAGWFAPAFCLTAEAEAASGAKSLQEWLVSRENFDTYYKKVKTILSDAARERLKARSIPEPYHPVFTRAVMATAWQESCFRQFVVKNQKLTFLLSYNNSSVGLMQINERVWRGIYSVESLRWDIRYNAAAGAEILDTYLTRYALPKLALLNPADRFGTDDVAFALYAMYNGGPGDFSKFLKRRSSGKLYKTDTHFREKYTWVKKGEWEKIRVCLFGA